MRARLAFPQLSLVATVLTCSFVLAVSASAQLAVVGQTNGPRVTVVDVSNPATPVVRGTVTTTLVGVSSIAVDATGSRVVAGELNGCRIALISIQNPDAPVQTGTVCTTFAGVSSVAVSGTRTIVGQQSGPGVELYDISGAAPVKIGVNLNTVLVGISSLAASGGCAIAGELNQNRVVGINIAGAGPVIAGSAVNTTLVGVSSVGLSGARAIAGQQNGPRVQALTTSACALTLGGSLNLSGIVGVAAVSLSGTRAIVGELNGPDVAIVDIINTAAPAQIGLAIGTGFAGVSSVAANGNIGVAGQQFGPGVRAITGITGATPTAAGSVLTTLVGVSSIALTSFSPPAVVFSATFAFPTVQRVGTASSPQALTITNTGGSQLQLTNITSSSARFAPQVTSLNVAAMSTGTLNVTFTPNAEGTVTGTLTAQTNDPARPSITITLSGTGGLPHLQVASSLSLPSAAANCQSTTNTLQISNTGALPLVVSSVSLPAGPFTRTPASLTVLANSNGSVQVTFTPTTVGPASATMTLATDDPANVSKTISLSGTGASAPPPSVVVNPTSLNFGATQVNFFIGKRITLTNNGTCSPLNVTLTSSSAVFPITSDPNPSTTPPSTTATSTLAPGASQSFVVVFAPTSAAPANGTLAVSSNDPANPNVSVPLSGTGVLAAASSLSMILDRSGSMADPVGGGTKMDALKAASKLFTDLIMDGQGDRLGTVEFDDVVTPLTPIANVDATQKASVKTTIDGLFPRGGTSIGGGLQAGLAQLTGSTTTRQVLMVFTDGVENVIPMIATVKPAIPATTEVYSVGFGDPSQISAAALTDLAISSGGRYFNPQDPLLLRKDFVQVLSDAFRQNMAFDPIYTMLAGSTRDIPVPLCTCDRRVSFIVYWQNPRSQLSVDVVAPNGMVYTSAAPLTNRLVRYVSQPGYRFYQIAFPPVDLAPGAVIGPPRAGTWIVRVRGDGLVGASERISVSVVVESDLMLKVAIDQARIGKPVRFTARLTEGANQVLGAHVTAQVRSPQRSIGGLLADLAPALRAATARRPQSRDTVLDRSLIIRELLRRRGNSFKPLVPTTVRSYRLYDDGQHGDGGAGDGLYGFVLPALAIEGGYTVEYKATAAVCDGMPLREGTLSFYAALPVDSSRTKVQVVTRPVPGAVTVSVTPRALDGALLGPGLATMIHATVAIDGRDVSRVTRVRDNLNGSYSIDVVNVQPGSVLHLDIDKTRFVVPLGRSNRTGKSQSSPVASPSQFNVGQ
ncbi:MAG TPA: choice-of-anchor D domain-containing protein [Gemmatimonadaceae bacterium]|nr:choice-of-anchor D domain-containing protein [Gemmatimonadaceae bacterium]